MEYPFKDLQPLDEVLEREGYYKDWTHLDPKVFYSLTQISNYIKTKGYGVDVRLLIAQLAEHFSLKTTQINQIELFFKDVMQELAEDKDYHSLPEISGARGGFDTLGERLNDTDTQLADTATKKIDRGKVTGVEFDLSSDANKLSLNHLKDADKQIIMDAAGELTINAVLAKDSIVQEYISDGAVSIDKLQLSNNKNLFDGQYFVGHIGGTKAGGIFNNTYSTARMAIIKVKPNTTYLIKKPNASEWYRIATSNKLIMPNVIPSNYIKDESVGGLNGDFVITTGVDDRYLAIVVSLTLSEEPPLFVYEQKSLKAYGKIEGSNVTLGKNLFDGIYLRNFMEGTLGGKAIWTTSEAGRFAEVPIKPSTTYTISKTASSRFKIALVSKSNARLLDNGLIVFDNSIANEATITTGVNDTYMQIYVANDGLEPDFMQVEESTTRTEWETYGYKFTPSAEKVNPVDDDIDLGFFDARQFGVFPGTSDVSNQLNTALQSAKGGKLYLPTGLYLIKKTIVIPTDTMIFGDGDTTVIQFDGDGSGLTGIFWRTFNTYSIVMTEENSKNIVVKDIRIKGNVSYFAAEQLQWGLTAYRCDGLIIDNVTITDINATGTTETEIRTGGDGWNLVLYESKNIRVLGGKFERGGYENIGTEHVENVVFDGVYCGDGWRASLQLHRDSKNVKIVNSTIKQNHEKAHSALTMHGTVGEEVENIIISNTYIESIASLGRLYRGCIQCVEGSEHGITLTGNTLVTNNYAISTGSDVPGISTKWIISDNKIKSDKVGIYGRFDKSIMSTNIIDSVEVAINNINTNAHVNVIDNNLLVDNQTINN